MPATMLEELRKHVLSWRWRHAESTGHVFSLTARLGARGRLLRAACMAGLLGLFVGVLWGHRLPFFLLWDEYDYVRFVYEGVRLDLMLGRAGFVIFFWPIWKACQAFGWSILDFPAAIQFVHILAKAKIHADLRGRLENARLDARALFRALDRLDITREEMPQDVIHELFEPDADCAEALWALDQPPRSLNLTAMVRDTLESLENIPVVRNEFLAKIPERSKASRFY